MKRVAFTNLKNVIKLNTSFWVFINMHRFLINNWSSHIRTVLETSYNIFNFKFKPQCEIDNTRVALKEQFIIEWKHHMLIKPKLRTYVNFKDSFNTEIYVKQTISRSRRSFLAQLRLGILPLEIETGRYTPIYDKEKKMNRRRHPSERLCALCELESIEDEVHFLLVCPLYQDLRLHLVDTISDSVPNFSTLPNHDKLVYLMQNCQHEVMSYVQKAWQRRSSRL